MNQPIINKRVSPLAWMICALAAIFYCYEFLLRIAPSVMTLELRKHFNLSAEGFGALIGLYYMIYTPMQIIVGVIMDLYGPRRVLTFAAAICALGNLIFGMTHEVWIAGIGRLLIGLGSSFAFVGALKLASLWLPINRFAFFTGLVTSLGMVGALAGDIGLTDLVQHLGWHQTVWFGTIFGIVLTPIIWFVIQDKSSTLLHSSTYREVFKGLSIVIRNNQIWLGGFVACMLYMSLSAFAEIWGIPFLRQTFHFTAHQAAVANSMIFLGWLIGGPVAGFISDRYGTRRWPLIVGGFFGAICITLVLYSPAESLMAISILLLLFGIFTSAENICFAVGRESAPNQISGTAVAFVNMLTMVGGFVFQPLIGKFLDLAWQGKMQDGLRVYGAHEYRVALIVLPIGVLLGAIVAFIMRESFRVEN